MAGRAVPTAIGPSDVRRYRFRLLRGKPRSSAPGASDRLAPKPSATWPAAPQRPRPDAEIVYGEVSWALSRNKLKVELQLEILAGRRHQRRPSRARPDHVDSIDPSSSTSA